ncbi:MAG: hypothetical protein VX252_15840 [Myxococcota bacterium]|nr:hypothetical protein [Myxococcota bacterium]
MQFLIRDDDACALTRPDEIERCYGRFWDEIPVGLSVTPFRIPDKPGHGMPETLSRLDEPHPLGDNSEMVSFLREQIAAGRIFVALHGYHHARVEGQPEYVGGQDLARKTREGRTYLEDLLDCSIHTFVPPNNAVGEAGFAAVVGAGLNLVNNQTYPLSFFQAAGRRARLNQALDLQYRLRVRLGMRSAYQKRRYLGFQQIAYRTLGPTQDLSDLEESLSLCARTNSTFILATHYHAFDRKLTSGESVGDGLLRLIERAKAHTSTKFIRYDELW